MTMENPENPAAPKGNSQGVFHQTRRHFLSATGYSLGSIALAWLHQSQLKSWGMKATPQASPYITKPPASIPRVKQVLQICSLGGVSHIDTFDYKPALKQYHGKELADRDFDPHRLKRGTVRQSPYEFCQKGQTGKWVSNLLPELGNQVDDLTFIHSMHSRNSNHTPATFLMNSGFAFNGFPNFGAWVSYGLGSDNLDLPAYIVLPDPRQLPAGGAINWTSGFLPSVHQGVAFHSKGETIPDLRTPSHISDNRRRSELLELNRLNRLFAVNHPGNTDLQARIRSYELAVKMQLSIPEITALDNESTATRKLYGLDQPTCRDFGRNCVLARRLIEKGVRFVQIYNGGGQGSPRVNWDAHENLEKNHGNEAAILDRPLAGLLKDLKSRGLLDHTLVLWTTEFGRTPITEGIEGKGRDHHRHAFTIWMTGAGVKPGISFGRTDDLGNRIAQDPVEYYDIHATILHLMGLNHETLTYYHDGIDRRLTDVHGNIIKDILS